MAKAVKAVGTAIMIVGAVVATGGMALAMGAGVGLLGSASLATSAVLSVGSFSVSAGALLSVGSLVSSIGGSLAQPKVSSAGGALGWVGDPNGPLHFAAGRIAVGGDLRHKAAYGPNDRMYFSAVTVVSDAGPIDAFESFTANDIAVTFDASGKANSSYYANVMWRRTQLGFQPEGSYLASPSGLQGGASLPNWGASHKLSGKAAFILTLSENSKHSAYKGQYPKPRTIIRGLRVYDWRRDSTYPGGSGPQRLNDPSTWAYSANPILWSVKWLLGLWEGPNGKGAPQADYQVGGIGTRWENIDVAAFTEAANIADTHGWTCAAWPSTDDDKAQVLDAFLQAGGAYYIERAGKASCIHRAAPRVSVATITAADTAGPIELDTSASYLDRKNTGVATYLSEADGWKMTALPEVSSSQWVTEDGGRKRSVPVTYSYVDKAKQAAELICLGLAHTREGISGRIPLKSYMQGIGPGSAFTITEPEFVLDGLKCLCLETNYDANTGVHTVTFVSETDAKYPYAFGQTPSPPPPPALTPVDPTHVSPPLPGDWTIIPRPPAPGGGQLPGFDLGGIVSNETATAVIVEHGPTDTGPWTQAYQGPPTVTNIPIDGLQPGATYYIAVQYQRDQNYSERYVYGPYTAPNLEPSHLNTEPVQDVLDRLTNTATLADQNRQAVEALEEVYGDTASAATSAAAAAASEAAATQAKADALIAKAGAESSASAAQTAKTAAETARAGAETAQSSAANSATTATGAAATATTQAGIATTAKNDAQAASSAAVTARNQASSFADAAGVSAAASQASSVSASAAKDGAVGTAIAGLPDAIAADLWTDLGTSGAPADRPSLAPQRVVNGAFVPPIGTILNAGPKQRVRWVQGKVIEIRLRAEVPAGTPAASVRIGVARFDANHASLNYGSWMAITPVASGGSAEVVYRIGCGVSVPGGSTISPGPEWLSLGCTPNLNAAASAGEPGAQMRITAFSVRDITESVNAAGSASAAATSAASAAASDTAAGQAASAAQTAKTQAETARGQAQTAATQAASSRDDAAGSAASASSSATNAANSRDAAAGSATAAAGSASTANTKATEAGNSASAAQASQVAATAAKDAAETAKGQAQSSASAASTSASNAAASATTAGEKAAAAEGSATTAATRAGEALTYRNQAASSASDAAGSAVTASTASGTAVSAKNDAQAAAATAVTQASNASASASSAQLSANLAASVSSRSGNLLTNTDFATTAGWTANVPININGGPSGYHPLGERVLTVSHATAQVDVYSSRVSVEEGKWYEVSAYLLAHRSQVKLFIRWVNAAGGYISSPETAWTTKSGGGNSSLSDYARLWLKAQAPAGAVAAVLMARKSTTQSGADSWMWMARPMLAETSATATGPALYTVGSGRDVLDAVDARASLALSTSVDAVTRLGQAAFELILASGGNPAYIKALAGPGGSEIAFAATKLLLRNVVGDQIVTALELLNGEAYFGAPVSVDISGRRLTIGPGFGVSSGLVLWFGPNTVSLASMSRTNGYFALGTDGKVYYGNAELGAGGGTGGAAMMRASCAGSVNSTSFATLASVTFANRPATGWWDASIFGLSGSSDGFADNDIEFRVIEQGATTPLATATITVPAGVPGLLSPYFSPSAPWPQTRPAGNLTLLLQARRAGGLGSSTFSAGDFTVNYTPGL
nr:fibronectin type III domain-containing protein [Brevundimonas diminuta]